MTEATTSNSSWWLLAWTLRLDHVDNSLVRGVIWLHKRDVFLRGIACTTLRTHDEPRGVAFQSWLPVSSVCSPSQVFSKHNSSEMIDNLPQDRRFRGASRLKSSVAART